MEWKRRSDDMVSIYTLHNYVQWKRKWQPTPVFLPEEPHGAWHVTVHGVTKSQL